MKAKELIEERKNIRIYISRIYERYLIVEEGRDYICSEVIKAIEKYCHDNKIALTIG
ncbi:hypothetical protein V6O07_02910 [Arthrospira platensis SPKY2]